MSIFFRVPVKKIVKEQLYEAERAFLEHQAAAEHHAALAEMYRKRAERLNDSEAAVVIDFPELTV